MKLPIKKEYFDLIKSGVKTLEYRDAHITFVCEETGETIRKDVVSVAMAYNTNDFPCCEDKLLIKFELDS